MRATIEIEIEVDESLTELGDNDGNVHMPNVLSDEIADALNVLIETRSKTGEGYVTKIKSVCVNEIVDDKNITWWEIQ